VEEQMEVKILVVLDCIFVEGLGLVNEYLNNQDNEYQDEVER